MKSCEDYQQLISASLDGESTDGERNELEHHLNSCQVCRQRRHAYVQVNELFEEFEPVRAEIAKRGAEVKGEPQQIPGAGRRRTQRTRQNLVRAGLLVGGVAASAALAAFVYSPPPSQPMETVTVTDLVQPLDKLYDLNRQSTKDQKIMASALEYELRALKLQLNNVSNDAADIDQYKQRIDELMRLVHQISD